MAKQPKATAITRTRKIAHTQVYVVGHYGLEKGENT